MSRETADGVRTEPAAEPAAAPAPAAEPNPWAPREYPAPPAGGTGAYPHPGGADGGRRRRLVWGLAFGAALLVAKGGLAVLNEVGEDRGDTGSAPPPASAPASGYREDRAVDEARFRMPAGLHLVTTRVTLEPVYLVTSVFTNEDGGRTGTVRVEATHVPGVPRGTAYRPAPDCGGRASCTVTARPDGAVVLTDTPVGAGGYPAHWSVAVYGTDGSLVTAGFDVDAASDRTRPYAEHPLLTVGELTEVALMPGWRIMAERPPVGSP
ncbi:MULTISPECIES: hypothetical protein [Kitasatospora]|uniref:Uncharacterized protein n=1 Tax=Kitasatospora setae (strain ATCC 33774 / DSM 43861 / JCM 3304 / KCC A-0304 / NBRC 14216 / KM-6054) TaxID=452652 RepID=E4NE67_KITSK|nr:MULTISPECIES: hypothetical protein [Kitasatospora]BAJ29498.1 hypothetical protein KSE_36960 [Kitasatospora setae KM-6054]